MSKPLVLITGATGHIGFRTLCLLLQANYRARVSLRRPEQAQKIKAAESIKPYLKDIEFVHVPDITRDNAFDEAIKDVEYVLHIASPIFDTQNQVEGVVSLSIGLDILRDYCWKQIHADMAVSRETGLKSCIIQPCAGLSAFSTPQRAQLA